MTPLEQFDRTIKRAEAIISLHRRTYSRQGRPPQEWSDVLRGALLLAVAALDALVDDLVCEFLPKAIVAGKQGPEIEKWVKNEPARPLAVLAARDKESSLAEWVKERHATDSFVNPWKIEEALRGELGCPISSEGANEPWARASKIMQELRPRTKQGVSAKEWTADEYRDLLVKIVRRRNDIAHDGDVDSRGRTKSIRRDQIAVAILAVACLGHAIFRVISEHLP